MRSTYSVMRVRLALRITAAIALIQSIGHAILFTTGRPRHGPAEVAVIEAMQSRSFDFGGFAPHSYWEMYYGYGILAVVFALFIACVLWLLADLAADVRHIRRFGVAIAVAVAIHSVIIARYFFKLPLIFDLLVLAGTIIALVMTSRRES